MSKFCHTPASETSALTAEGVCKSYGPRRVLSAITMRVRRGEGVALCGPNGAGKSTLLSLFAGLARPDGGSVQVFGASPWTPATRRALGFVPQELALYPELTGAENVTLFGRLFGLRWRALRDGVHDALAKVDLLPVANVRAGTYSGGMSRRLSVACALVHGPSLLLLDEPFVGMDDRARDQLITALALQKRTGLTLVLSTHARDEALVLCERMLVMANGHLVGDEPLAARSVARLARRAVGAS